MEDKRDQAKEVEVTKSDLSENNLKDVNESKDDEKKTVHVVKTAVETVTSINKP